MNRDEVNDNGSIVRTVGGGGGFPLTENWLFQRKCKSPSLTTKTPSSIPSKGSFTGKSVPKGNQGCLIHCIGSLGTTKKRKRIGSDTPVEIHPSIMMTSLTWYPAASSTPSPSPWRPAVAAILIQIQIQMQFWFSTIEPFWFSRKKKKKKKKKKK